MTAVGFGLVSFGLVLLIGAWCNWKLRPRWKDVDGVRVPAWWTDDMVASWAARRLDERRAERRATERGRSTTGNWKPGDAA